MKSGLATSTLQEFWGFNVYRPCRIQPNQMEMYGGPYKRTQFFKPPLGGP